MSVLPEGRVPATAGEKFLTISIERFTTMSNTQYPKRYIGFAVHIVRRIRAIPNDRFGSVYFDTEEFANQHEAIINSIVSLALLEKVIAGMDALYGITTNFKHTTTNLNPTQLYPGYFLTKPSNNPELDNNIAGYKTTSYFNSPSFSLKDNPLTC